MPASVEPFLAAIRSQLPDSRVRTDADSLATHGCDWTRIYTPAPAAILFPDSLESVRHIVCQAREHRIALVPSGGRTGLSGGAVACNGEVVVSFDYMNRILDFDPLDRTVSCQAGVVTEQLQDFAAEQGLFYPVDFASAGSSQLGGNIATNAGGIKVIRYGMTRDWVAGLTVVTGRGEVLKLNRGLVKNATGYDLRHLFVGSEGTLGLIVEAEMRLARQPGDLNVLVLGVPDFAAMMQVLDAYQRKFDLTAFEFFSAAALRHVISHSGLQPPFDTDTPYYALLELETLNDEMVEAALAVFESCVEQSWVLDGVMSQNEAQAAALWRLREGISESIAQFTPYKNDISVRVSRVPAFLAEVDALVSAEYPDFELIWFGHIGDGNLHLNILRPAQMEKDAFFSRCHAVSSKVMEIVQAHGGSVSAEHGVGLVKKDYLHYTREAAEIESMRALKAVFDPDGIMNPGKVFD